MSTLERKYKFYLLDQIVFFCRSKESRNPPAWQPSGGGLHYRNYRRTICPTDELSDSDHGGNLFFHALTFVCSVTHLYSDTPMFQHPYVMLRQLSLYSDIPMFLIPLYSDQNTKYWCRLFGSLK